MVTEYGKLTVTIISWILNKISIQLNDSQILLVSFLFLSIILLITLLINNCICKKV